MNLPFWPGRSIKVQGPNRQHLRHQHLPQLDSLTTQAIAMGAIIALTQLTVYGLVAVGGVKAKAELGSSGAAQVRAGQAMGWLLVLGAARMLWRGWQGNA